MDINRQTLLKQLDFVFVEYLKKRDGYACVITGAKRNLAVHRMVNSDQLCIRYDPNNAFLVLRKLSDGFNSNPAPILRYYLSRYSLDYMDEVAGRKDKDVTDDVLCELIHKFVALTDPIRDRRRWDERTVG